MTPFLRTLRALIAIAVILATTACSHDDPIAEQFSYYDIVRLTYQSDREAVFERYLPGTNEVVKYYSDRLIDLDRVDIGNRLLIHYIPANDDIARTGRINLLGYGTVTNATLTTVSADELEGVVGDPIYVVSSWLAGPYLNMRLRLPYDERPRAFGIAHLADSDPEWPDLYLVHARQDDATTFDRTYYASFNLTSLINDTDAKGFTLHVNDTNLGVDAIRYTISR